MNFLYELLGTPLGYIVWALYQVFQNYGVSIIIFTVLLRLAMVPLSIKQQKSSAKMAAFQPLVQEINKKYANNPQKKNEELQKLYSEEGYSPMSGCLPMVLQFIVLFGIIDVVYRPLTHMLHLPADLINKAIEICGSQNVGMQAQLAVVNDVQQHADKYSSLGADFVNSIKGLNMSFLGMDTGVRPSAGDITILIPILAFVFSLLSVFVSMKSNPTTANAPGGKGMKIFMFGMPLFSLFIAFTVPIGVGLYWIIGSVCMVVQSLILNRIYNPIALREQAKAEMELRRKNKKKKKVVTKAVVKKEDGKEVLSEEELTQKELDRKLLAEARKRDAEKYGEEYVEVTDKDLKG